MDRTLHDTPPPLPTEIQLLFDYRPPALSTRAEWSSHPQVSPFWFYDRHLDEKLNLLHVKPMPTLPKDLAALVDDGILAMRLRGFPLPEVSSTSVFTPEAYRRGFFPRVTDATSVGRFYDNTIANSCESVASVLAIHPHTSEWLPALMWAKTDGEWRPPSSWDEDFSIRIRFEPETDELLMPNGLPELLGHRTLQNLKDLARRFPELATCEIGVVSTETEFILRDMDRLTAGGFKPIFCGTVGTLPSISVYTPPPDPLSIPWTTRKPLSAVVSRATKRKSLKIHSSVDDSPPRRSLRLHKLLQNAVRQHQPTTRTRVPTQTSSQLPSPNNSAVRINRRSDITPPVRHATHRSQQTDFLVQHTWVRAVCSDTTIILFHCGNFERIGIRHRNSQTLYLSDLIDVVHDTDPARGKLHVGLYMAAYLDTMDRFIQLKELESHPQPPPKVLVPKIPPAPLGRLANKKSTTTKKRNRAAFEADISTDDVESESSIIFREAGLRNLALIQLRYGVFNSVSPASFLRVGRSLAPVIGPIRPPRVRRKYSTREHFTLLLHSTIGRGATGHVHNASLELTTSGGKELAHEVVVKLAFTPEQQERLEHEYSIYRHLASSGVHGIIVDVFGLFRDIEGDTMAIVMSHGAPNGSSLLDTYTAIYDDPSSAAFLAAMKVIHDAGVCHNDVRPPNLLLDDKGKITILDFDRADLMSSEEQREREMGTLTDLLDGVDPEY
ncbi:MAP kinase kinase MKK1/SSP32 [Hypsizygus marmoreus]|uniref:MAP kinase kinase MKK1/SSP32 n=1 Tax=Hypsizygus marmoreus TaxID=39966 RepID=A0A369J5M4_HYPMA|nr:MAP kinase kinase MKK1/SSP32 [Hypsizygus marmoreus]